MKKELWTYKGQIYTHINSNILSALDKIALNNSSVITYDNIERNQKKGISINYRYTGSKQNIDQIQKDINRLKFNIAQQHLHHYFTTHNVNSVEEKISGNEFNMTVNVNRFSSFMEIAQAVALELDITTRIYEKSLGFFKGKDIHVQVMAEPNELIKYKTLINEFIEQPSEVKTQKKKI